MVIERMMERMVSSNVLRTRVGVALVNGGCVTEFDRSGLAYVNWHTSRRLLLLMALADRTFATPVQPRAALRFDRRNQQIFTH
jgi:hypothetical protein